MFKKLLAIVVLALVAAATFLHYSPSPYTESKFFSPTWLTADPSTGCVRGAMAADLITNHLPQGLSHADVTDLLGVPNRYQADSKQADFSLGLCDNTGRPSTLTLTFNDADQLIKSFIHKD